MTSQFDFTNNEWSDISALPVLVGYAVARAEDSGRLGNSREIRTLVNTIAKQVPDNPARPLIDAVSIVDVQDRIDGFEDHSPELLADVAVATCREIAAVLDDRAEPDEAAAYKAWVYNIAVQVAEAAREHGVVISDGEAALLVRTMDALGI